MTPQTTAAVLIGVVLVGCVVVYTANKVEASKVGTRDGTALGGGSSFGANFNVVGGKLLNRDGTPATAQDVQHAAAKASGNSSVNALVGIADKVKFW